MTTGDALLKAILRDPADDTARLVYADWLEENGREEEADRIRRQTVRPCSHGGQYRHWLSEPEPGDAWADPS